MKPWAVAMAVACAAAVTVSACSFPAVTFAVDASMGVDAMADTYVVEETSTVDVPINMEAGCVDLDNDKFYDMFTNCDSGLATDCDDNDPNVNPGMTAFNTTVPTGGNKGLMPYPNGDWNCDGKVVYQYGTFTTSQCTSMAVTCKGSGFQLQQECGQVGFWGTCSGVGVCSYKDGGQVPQGCL